MTDAEKDATVRIAKRACSGAYPEGQIEFEIEQLVAEKDARIAAAEKEVTAQFQLREATAKAQFQWQRAEKAEATIAAARHLSAVARTNDFLPVRTFLDSLDALLASKDTNEV